MSPFKPAESLKCAPAIVISQVVPGTPTVISFPQSTFKSSAPVAEKENFLTSLYSLLVLTTLLNVV